MAFFIFKTETFNHVNNPFRLALYDFNLRTVMTHQVELKTQVAFKTLL